MKWVLKMSQGVNQLTDKANYLCAPFGALHYFLRQTFILKKIQVRGSISI